MLVVALTVCIYLNARLALVLVVVIPVMVVVIAFLMKMCTKLFEVMQKKIDGLNNTLQENLVAIRVVKAFVRENHERGKFKKANDELMEAGLNVGMRIVAIMPIMMLAMNGAVVSVLYLGGRMVMGATFDLGSLQAFISYITQILMSVMMVAMSLLQLSRAQACAHRINEVLTARPSVEDKETAVRSDLPAPRGKVEFRDVTARYAGSANPSLEHISFTAQPGQTVGIIGGTGSGKTTLVNLIPRLYDAAEGAVLLDGRNVQDYDMVSLRRRIGVVPQKAVLFKGTIRQNLKWGNENATENALWDALKTAQASEVVLGKDGGLDAPVEQGGANFSGGQRQRLTIARALVRKPAILILDDSASALDYATDANLRMAIRSMDNPPTTFIVSQRAASVRYADEILVLDDGLLVGKGTHEELLKDCPTYQEIYYSQFPKEAAGNE